MNYVADLNHDGKVMRLPKTYLQIPFLICIGLLVVSVIGIKAVMHWAHAQIGNMPISLQIPLDQLDKKLLSPYTVIKQTKIENRDELEWLGTEDYIQWILEDPEVPTDSPVRYCSLFITYFTGNPNRVPRVPEREYVGEGPIQKDSQNLRLHLDNPSMFGTAALPVELPVRRAIFAYKQHNLSDPQSEFSVQYFFKANGQYADGRTGARLIMSKNYTCKYSYFSKVEWKFSATPDYLPTEKAPTDNEIIQASEKFLSVLLPILETQHWPDWEKATKNSIPKR
jgi:hypothetical protein